MTQANLAYKSTELFKRARPGFVYVADEDLSESVLSLCAHDMNR